MAIPVWPAALPQELITDGYGQQAPNTIIATQMDVGPGKRRRRTSAGVQPVRGQIVVTEEQLETLREFFHKDLGDGALRFAWVDPVSSPNPAGDARMVLDGTNGTYASTPHSESQWMSKLTIVAKIAPEMWGDGTNQGILSKWRPNTHGMSYALQLTSSGALAFRVSIEGDSTELTKTTPNHGGVGREPQWVAVTYAGDNGEGGHTWAFYISADGFGWEVIDQGSGAGIFVPYVSSADITLANNHGGFQTINGKIYRAQIYSGAGFDLNGGPTGTLVADFNPGDAPRSLSGGGSFTSSATGEVWTLHGSASIHNPTVGVPVEMRFTEPPQWSARTSGIYTVSLALEILP